MLEYFADRPDDLLVMELEKGDGWGKLGAFLGIPVPEGQFIRTNTSRQRTSLFERVRRRLRRLGFQVGADMDG